MSVSEAEPWVLSVPSHSLSPQTAEGTPPALQTCTLLGWHDLSNAACLMRPRLLYLCFDVSEAEPWVLSVPIREMGGAPRNPATRLLGTTCWCGFCQDPTNKS